METKNVSKVVSDKQLMEFNYSSGILEMDENPILQSMEEIQEQNRLEVEKFKEDPENKKKAFDLAVSIEGLMGTKWFTLPKLVKKTGDKPEALFQKLKLLELFDYCVIDKGEALSKERGMWVFNITLDPRDKIAAIQRVIDTHKQDIKDLELKIKIIEAKIAPNPQAVSSK